MAFYFIFLNGGTKTTELNRHGTYHPPFLSRRQRRWRRKSSFSLQYRDQYTGLSELLYICLLLPDPYLHMRIVLLLRKNYTKGFGKELCLFLLPLLEEVCRQMEHTLPLLCSRETVKQSSASEDTVLVKSWFKQG